MRVKHLLSTVALLVLGTATAVAQDNGRIEGQVQRDDGTPIAGVTVVLSELGEVEFTRGDGSFDFDNLPAGDYNLAFSLGDNSDSRTVEVTSGATARVDLQVPWDVSFAETITVVSVSRRRERIVEAPAAVTSIPAEQIEREASHGQLPKLLEYSPGVEVTQSGVFDYNLNTRGFNSSLNRRVVVLVDGRDPSVPFLASQEWATTSQYMNDLETAEMVRGPSSALYGANAFNGVLNLITKAPRYSQGGELRLTGGELSTQKIDFRWATELGADWFLKLNGSYLDSDDFSQDRLDLNGNGVLDVPSEAEYAGLVPEVRPRVVTDNNVVFGNLRLDKYVTDDSFLTLEAGGAEIEGPALQTGIGRFSLPSIERQWARANFSAPHWNFLGYFNSRVGDEQTSLQSGAVTFLDSENYKFEVQTNWDFADGKVRLVAGASHKEEEISTASPTGRETLLFAPVDSDSQAVFGQLDFDLGEKVKLVLAGRYDESTLHDSQFSPKGSLVWSPATNHSIRFSYNEAFQVANYSEFFLQADAALPVTALAAVEGGLCMPFGISCGLGLVRVLAVGNDDLEVEEVTSWEVGYTGIVANKAFVTIDYYNNELENFITDLLPNVGTSLGRLNPDFGPYTPPAATNNIFVAPGVPLSAALVGTLMDALGPTFFALSNNLDGSPVIVGASYTNFGQVDTQGVDLGVNVFVNERWRANFNYSWFDFDIKQQVAGDALEANAPENKFSAGLAYVAESFDIATNVRWVDDFAWAVGTLFIGTVESYTTVDLTGNYRFNNNWEIGVNISNLLDDDHYEAFGGDLVTRRALGHVAFRW